MNRIREARKEQGIKQTDLCRRIGVSQATLSGWESGRFEPNAAAWVSLSKHLNVSIEYLMGAMGCRVITGREQVLERELWELIDAYTELDERGRETVRQCVQQQRRYSRSYDSFER